MPYRSLPFALSRQPGGAYMTDGMGRIR